MPSSATFGLYSEWEEASKTRSGRGERPSVLVGGGRGERREEGRGEIDLERPEGPFGHFPPLGPGGVLTVLVTTNFHVGVSAYVTIISTECVMTCSCVYVRSVRGYFSTIIEVKCLNSFD